MNYTTRKQKEAFLADVKAVEQKHGLRLGITMADPVFDIRPLVPVVSQEARDAVDEIVNGPKLPWYKRLFNTT